MKRGHKKGGERGTEGMAGSSIQVTIVHAWRSCMYIFGISEAAFGTRDTPCAYEHSMESREPHGHMGPAILSYTPTRKIHARSMQRATAVLTITAH